MYKPFYRKIHYPIPGMEQMKTYVENTKLMYNSRYDILSNEMLELVKLADRKFLVEAIGTAFVYGQAKGYRQAKAEEKKKTEA